MSVLVSDIRTYSASVTSDTVGAVGGACAFNCKPTFSDLTANVVPSVVSGSASDTGCTLAISTLSPTGTAQSETITVAGTSVTSATLAASRFQKVIAAGVTAVSDLAVLGNKTISNHSLVSGSSGGCVLQAGDGAACVLGNIIRLTSGTGQYQLRSIVAISGDTITVSRAWATIPTTAIYDIWNGCLLDQAPNQIVQVRRPFMNAYASAIGGVTNIWIEKYFICNDNLTTALTGCQIAKFIDPTGLTTGSGALNIALALNLSDSSSLTTNLNGPAPTNITAWTSGAAPQTLSIPSAATLPSGSSPNAAALKPCGAPSAWSRASRPSPPRRCLICAPPARRSNRG